MLKVAEARKQIHSADAGVLTNSSHCSQYANISADGAEKAPVKFGARCTAFIALRGDNVTE